MGVSMAIGLNVPNFIRGLDNNRIGCTKFYEECIKFCEGCTKGLKVHSRVENDLSSINTDP